MLIPSPNRRGLLNLVAEIETRFTGSARAPILEPELGTLIPAGQSLVLALFDGLGASQAAEVDDFASSIAGVLHAPFPTTTTVSLATVATGRAAKGHGVLGHLMWLSEVNSVTNVLKFAKPEGQPVVLDHARFLPGETLWERLRQAGIEPVTVQPGGFAGSPLSTALYRGCRFESVWSKSEWVDATVQLAAEPNRLVFAYWPDVDVTAHVAGRRSETYRRAAIEAGRMWRRLQERLDAPLVGTADHGHLDYRESGKLLLRSPRMSEFTWFGDSRALMVRGDAQSAGDLLADTGAQIVERHEFSSWFGEDPDPHPRLQERLPDLIALAPDDTLLLPRGFDRRLVGYHGGLRHAEVEVPLLIGS